MVAARSALLGNSHTLTIQSVRSLQCSLSLVPTRPTLFVVSRAVLIVWIWWFTRWVLSHHTVQVSFVHEVGLGIMGCVKSVVKVTSQQVVWKGLVVNQ